MRANPIPGTGTSAANPVNSSVAIRAASCALFLLALSISTRVYNLSAASLWFDEAVSWRLATFPLPALIERTGRDNSPPLHGIVLKGWMLAFGESVAALRGLSVVCGFLTVVGTFVFLREAFRACEHSLRSSAIAPEIAMYGALFVALSAFQIHWARQARMYALGVALVVWSSWALVAALRRSERSTPYWAAYSVLTLAFLYTHTIAVVSVACQAALVLGYFIVQHSLAPRALAASPNVRKAGCAFAAAALGWLPWVPTLLTQRTQVAHDFWTRPLTARSFLETLYLMFGDPRAGMVAVSSVPIGDAALVTAALCAGLVVILWRPTLGKAAIALLAAGPVVGCVLISALDVPLLYVRYLIFAHVFVLMGGAALLALVPSRVTRVALFVLALGNMTWLSGTDFLLQAGEKPGERLTAEYLDEVRNPGEPVVVCHTTRFVSLLYHSQQRDGWRTYASNGHVIHYHGAAAILDWEIIDEPGITNLDASVVWTVDLEWPGQGSQAVPVPADCSRISERRFPTQHGPPGTEFVVRQYMTRDDPAGVGSE